MQCNFKVRFFVSLQLYIRSDSVRRIHSYSIPIPKSILKFGMASVRMFGHRPVSGRQRLLLHFTRVCAHVGTFVPPRSDARDPSGSCAHARGPMHPCLHPPFTSHVRDPAPLPPSPSASYAHARHPTSYSRRVPLQHVQHKITSAAETHATYV